MAKSNTISLRNFHELDAILASAFRKRDAGTVLYGAITDGSAIVRKAIRSEVEPSKGKKTAGGGRKVQPSGTLRRSVKSGLRKKGYAKDPNLFAGSVFTDRDFSYGKTDGWYAHFINFGTKGKRGKAAKKKTFFRKGNKQGTSNGSIKANPFMDKGFAKSKKAAELRIKFGIYTRTKQLQQKINMLR